MKGGPQDPVNSSSNRICTQASVITEITHVARAGPVLWDTQSVSLVVPFELLNFAAAEHCTFPHIVSIAESDSKRYEGRALYSIYTSHFVRKGLGKRDGREMHCMPYLFSNLKGSLVYV